MRLLANRQVLLAIVVFGLVAAACTTSTPPPPAPAAPAAVSPSPVAQASPAPQAPVAPVGGGAAQPIVQATSPAIGASGAIIVPTPNFAVQATNVPAAFAPNVSLTTPQAPQPAQVSGTLSRIPTAIPPVQNAGQLAAISTATAGGGPVGINQIVIAVAGAANAAGVGGGGGGGGGGAQTVPVVQTATPVLRAVPAPQPTLAFPGR